MHPFKTSAALETVSFRIDASCETGFDRLPVSGTFHRSADTPSRGKVRALRDPGVAVAQPPDVTGIYRFCIHRGQQPPLIYVGKASSLRSRYRDYVEMVRRLLAVYRGFEVWTDGNGFRYVHYELADAMLQDPTVAVDFDYF